jgi:putative alpha-1,2-mannosidase
VSYASNHKAAILTLEYAFDGRGTPAPKNECSRLLPLIVFVTDWAVGNMAAALNNSAAAELFYNRSKNYRVRAQSP